jgi:hypothetical protein
MSGACSNTIKKKEKQNKRTKQTKQTNKQARCTSASSHAHLSHLPAPGSRSHDKVARLECDEFAEAGKGCCPGRARYKEIRSEAPQTLITMSHLADDIGKRDGTCEAHSILQLLQKNRACVEHPDSVLSTQSRLRAALLHHTAC